MLLERHVITPMQKKHQLQRVDVRIILSLVKNVQLSKNALAEHVGMQSSAMSRSLDRLIARGFVARKEDAKDRRGIKLYLTPKGKKLHQTVANFMSQYWAQLCEGIADADIQAHAEFIQYLAARIKPINFGGKSHDE
ncbi:MAG: MarR family transcriptional regulator [Pseudomonadota bacterium]